MPNLTPRDRKKEALRRIGVTPSQLQSVPNITSILKETRGGIKLAIAALRFSTNDAVTAFMEKYDSISDRDRESLPIEAIALSVNTDTRILLAYIIILAREGSANTVKMIAFSNHPAVYKKRVQFAKQPGGYRDRDAIDTMLGALPSPKGPTFIGKIIHNAASDDEDESDELSSSEDYIFPDASEIQNRTNSIRQRLLEK